MFDRLIQFDDVAKIFEGTNEGLFVINSDYDVKHYNSSFYDQFSLFSDDDYICSLDEWVAHIHEVDRLRVRNKFKEFMDCSNDSYFQETYRVYLKSKEVCWICSRAMIICDENNHVGAVVGIHRDVSSEKHVDDMLYDFTYVDDLTGLLNQAKLEKVLTSYIADKQSGVLVYININEFKLINELYGTMAGDRVLIRVSEILKQYEYLAKMNFRIHGDEFVLLIEHDMSVEEIYNFVNALREKIQKRFFIKRKPFGIKVSIGICMLPMELDTSVELIQRAQWTMNYAKRKMHNMVAIFDNVIHRCIVKDMYIQSEIKSAMKNDEFYLTFQPIIDVGKQNVDKFESLIRWKSGVFGEIFPDEFIGIAEDNGDIIDIGQFVLEKACEFVKQMKHTYNRDVYVSVNVSVVQLMERKYVSNFISTIEKIGVDITSIVIEITESHMLEGSATMIKKLKILSQMGVKIALDDFGTGYSSLNSLLLLPLSYVKIDRSVMNKMMDRDEIGKFIRSVISLCGEMDFEVVCEGIETIQMVKKAEKIGAKFLQGYYFSRPLCELKASEYQLSIE